MESSNWKGPPRDCTGWEDSKESLGGWSKEVISKETEGLFGARISSLWGKDKSCVFITQILSSSSRGWRPLVTDNLIAVDQKILLLKTIFLEKVETATTSVLSLILV